VRDVAAEQALLDAVGQGSRDLALELRKVVGIDLSGETESSVNNGRVDLLQEVLGDGAGAGVFGVEASDTDGGSAVEVLLPVDAALREDGALELGKGGIELGVLVVLHHEAGEHALLAGRREGEELSGARVDVRRVKTARLEEDCSCGDTKSREDGEVGTLGQVNLTTSTRSDSWVRRRVEVELQVDLIGIQALLDDIEALNRVGCSQKLAHKVGRGGWVRLGCWHTENTAGCHCGGSASVIGSSISRVGCTGAGIERRSISGRGGKRGQKN